MSFSDLRFLFYFLPAFILLHTVAPAKLRNILLFFGSLGIYFWGAGWRAAAILFAAILLNYLFGLGLEAAWGRLRRLLYVFSLLVDLGILVYFKYSAALSGVFASGAALRSAALPLGVSFYMFQLAAYLIDVRHDIVSAEHSFVDFGAYVAAFPQLTMGPILRYGDLRGALKARRPSLSELEQGFQLFVVGLSFKVLLADQLAYLWSALERIGFDYISTPLAWLGAVGYSLQLYFDFFGYSLMAVGLGRMLALPIPRNFDEPYLSRSVSEFYRRWHITLGAWFRDYLYIPLGGSRHGTVRTIFALAAVWFLTGLWHGSTPNYFIWSAALFVCIALERLFLRRVFAKTRALPHIYLLFVIVQTWVVFRITDLADLAAYFRRLYPFFGNDAAINYGDFFKYFSSYWWLFVIGIVCCLPQPRRFYESHRGSPVIWLPLFVLFWLSIYFLATGSGSAFLYFRF